MKEFNLNDGSCLLALSFAFDETQVLGIEYRSQKYFDYVEIRKYEIWEAIKNHTYSFTEFKNELANKGHF